MRARIVDKLFHWNESINMKIVTIGVYGYTAEKFFSDLCNAGVDVFCDIRWRRGVRGADYAFANYQRLRNQLESLGIRYLHRRDLAPSPEIRKLQHAVDVSEKIAKRKRDTLSDPFKEAYQEQILANFDITDFFEQLGTDEHCVAFCCVERLPEACHRHLLANEIREKLEVDIQHLLPDG